MPVRFLDCSGIAAALKIRSIAARDAHRVASGRKGVTHALGFDARSGKTMRRVPGRGACDPCPATWPHAYRTISVPSTGACLI